MESRNVCSIVARMNSYSLMANATKNVGIALQAPRIYMVILYALSLVVLETSCIRMANVTRPVMVRALKSKMTVYLMYIIVSLNASILINSIWTKIDNVSKNALRVIKPSAIMVIATVNPFALKINSIMMMAPVNPNVQNTMMSKKSMAFNSVSTLAMKQNT